MAQKAKTLTERQYERGIWNPKMVATAISEKVNSENVTGIGAVVIKGDGTAEFLSSSDNSFELLGAIDLLHQSIRNEID
ncbi:hypothetical protein [Lactiplantibacillus daowaiensis]|uniref:CMP/dCMP-type deaminase domain-containing protein n=1 Tax=Lactiplantibacillus daowaiensis TaxID=2559918 RepID=A0ABW1RY53_9LACO|nr:hypothetical protein [Lactiplantibacillus daowaiensis]